MDLQIGQELREARTRRGVELSEVERVTKIRTKFLEAMEEDRWEQLPAPVYTRSFLSTYARFLDLDDEPLVDEYDRWAEQAERAEPIPPQAVRRGTLRPRRPIGPIAALLGSLIAAGVVLGLVIAAVGGSGDGDDGVDRGAENRAGENRGGETRGEETEADSATEEQAPALAGEVSVELRSTGVVWVCLVDDRDRPLVNGVTLAANQAVGPFDGRGFNVTFGNGSVEMTVDGEPAEIPPLAEPLGYRITPSGVRELDSADQPSCL